MSKIHFNLFIVGGVLTFASIFAAIQLKFSYWYLPFLVGSWFFFDFIDFKYRKTSILSKLLQGNLEKVLIVYLMWALMGLFLDVFFGIILGELWFYPSHNRGIHFLYPPLLIYPLGAFSVYELYYGVRGFVGKKFKELKIIETKGKELIAKLQLLIALISGIIPFVFLLLGQTGFIKELLVVLMVLNIFAFDALQYILSKKSILFNLINLNKLEIITLAISLFLSVLLHEFPNVFAKEWVYQNIPFVSVELFGIPLIVATIGWLFLIVNVVGSGNAILFSKK